MLVIEAELASVLDWDDLAAADPGGEDIPSTAILAVTNDTRHSKDVAWLFPGWDDPVSVNVAGGGKWTIGPFQSPYGSSVPFTVRVVYPDGAAGLRVAAIDTAAGTAPIPGLA
jgi:hypothetical protein